MKRACCTLRKSLAAVRTPPCSFAVPLDLFASSAVRFQNPRAGLFLIWKHSLDMPWAIYYCIDTLCLAQYYRRAMENPKKLLFVTGSRGEWGYIRPLLRLCQNREKEVTYSICATNMHLLPAHGMPLKEIEADGFRIDDLIHMSLDGYDHFTMTKSLAIFFSSFMDTLLRVRPDWIVLAGDRGEQLMGAIAGAYTYTPVAHIQAGEKSGNIDGTARHALAKLAHVHFAANDDAAQRLIRSGEEPFRVHQVGAPMLDELVEGKETPLQRLSVQYNMDLSKPYLLVVQHSVTEEYDQADAQIAATMDALAQFAMTKIWILPNNDAGSSIIRSGILARKRGDTYTFQNCKREDYLGLMKQAACIVGNSSSAVIEAPVYKVPAVNIGRRQSARLQGENVINCGFSVSEIVEAIRRAISPEFRATLDHCVSPYGDGRSSPRILDVLINTPKTDALLRKQITF